MLSLTSVGLTSVGLTSVGLNSVGLPNVGLNSVGPDHRRVQQGHLPYRRRTAQRPSRSGLHPDPEAL